ncbi:MAG: hypothetical protein H7301_11605 [Cryobacterium sp.]|nr:hypothetical protein [Oligoflexia bacterium]
MEKLRLIAAVLFSTFLSISSAQAFGRARSQEPQPLPTVAPPPLPAPTPSPSPSPFPVPTRTPAHHPPSPSTPPHVPAQVIQGWIQDYTLHVENVVAGTYPGLLSLGASRMSVVCPNWAALDRGEREKFWSSLLWSIAGPESGRNRTAIYLEDTMGIDPITGQQIRSEGFLQLSYTDVGAYRYLGGDVSWSEDRVMAIQDYALKKKSGNPERTLLDAYANLNLGLWIMHRRIEVTNPTGNIETTLGKYWSTMRSNGKTFKTVLSNLKGRIPECFH